MHASGNYIYIVFAALYIIYSIIKAGKKAASQQPAPEKREPSSTVQPPTASPIPAPGGELKKMLDDVLGKIPASGSAKPPGKPAGSALKQVKDSPKPAKKKAIPFVPLKAKKEASSHAPPQPPSAQQISSGPVQEKDPATEFDIREAVIYSEILKRPDW